MCRRNTDFPLSADLYPGSRCPLTAEGDFGSTLVTRMAEKKTIVVNGGANGGRLAPEPAASGGDELERARDIARRYRCEFIDLSDFQLHHNLFEKIPVHLKIGRASCRERV